MSKVLFIRSDTPLPKRAFQDTYTTERTLIRGAVGYLISAFHRDSPVSILDLGAHDGRWGKEAGDLVPGKARLVGMEIRDEPIPEGFDLWFPETDVLKWSWNERFDLVVSNPPYKHAEEFIRYGWERLAPEGWMAFLLPLSFMTSEKRKDGLWQEIPPYTVGACSRRPSFYGGKTNSDSYGIYYWGKDQQGNNLGTPGTWPIFLFTYERDTSDQEQF